MIGESPGVWVADVEMIDVVSPQGPDVDSAYGMRQLGLRELKQQESNLCLF